MANSAIYYLEIRHKLVHTDGVVDEEFKEKHDTLKYNTSGNKIKLSYNTIHAAYDAVFQLVSDIDSKVIRAGLVNSNTHKGDR